MEEEKERTNSEKRPYRSPVVRELDEQLADRLRAVRQALYVPTHGESMGKKERRNHQRELLANEMGVKPEFIEMAENRKKRLSASHLLLIMKRYQVDVSFFFDTQARLPAAFVLEQQQQELSHRMEILGAAGTYLSRPRQPVRRRTSTGGWMKGLPRRAKTPEQAALIAAWRRGRDEGRHFNGVDDVKAYQAEIGSEKPEEPKKRAERSK